MSDSRLFKLLYYLLDAGRATAPELAERFEVSPRTIYRDIDALSGAGIPVYAEPGRNGGIFLAHGFVLDRAALSQRERREILTAMQSVSATGYDPGKETLTKLSALFNANAGDWLEVDFSRWGSGPRDNGKWELLKLATMEHKTIKILYANANGQQSQRAVQPLQLSYRSKDWYLKAFCLEKQDFRIFKLNRILKLELLERTFVPRPFPKQETRNRRNHPAVTLLFSKQAAYRVYDEFDESQITPQENGDLLACAEMPVDAWLMGYLLSFGTQVEVVEPRPLRELLAVQAQAIYEKNKP